MWNLHVVIATVARVLRKRGLWLIVRVNRNNGTVSLEMKEQAITVLYL